MTAPFPVAAVVLAKNEEHNIRRCLEALTGCAERVVIDDGSTDRTAEIAGECGARVLSHPFESFASQRNWALDYADLASPWVLMLDADEVATADFFHELTAAVSSAGPDVAGYLICRKTMFMGKWLKYSDGFPVWIMRVVRRGRARFEDRGHGEVAVPKVDGTLPMIREPIIHYAFSRGVSDWVERHNRYAAREAQLEFERQTAWSMTDLLSRSRAQRRHALRNLARSLPGRPQLRFLYQYLLKRGILDGRPGYLFSKLMASYEGLIQLKKEELELKAQGKDL